MASNQNERRRNAVRFELQGNLQMDRLQFSRNIIMGELGFAAQQLDFLFAMPCKKVFEVVFATFDFFEHCLDRFHQKRPNNPRLENVKLIPLSERENKSVTVIMYSENVTKEDIQTWLSFHCEVTNGIELRDQDGIMTGARRYYCKLRRDQESGQLQHLPSKIQLGRVRGNVFYQGQPRTCNKCGSPSHLAADCNSNTFCRHCRTSTHNTRDCVEPKKCNLCGATTHTFRSCPSSYANRTAPRRATDDDQEGPPATDGRPALQHQAADHQRAEPAPDDQGDPTTVASVPAAPAAEENPEPPSEETPAPTAEETTTPRGEITTAPGEDNTGPLGEDDPIDELRIPDWGDSPMEGDLEEAEGSQEVRLDLPAQLANSTVISAADCRELLDAWTSDLIPLGQLQAFANPTTPKSTPMKRPQPLSSGDSNDNETKVWPPLPSTFSFLDQGSIDQFSSATQFLGARDNMGEAKPKPRRQRSKNPN